MKIEYQKTKHDLARWQRLNKTDSAWRNYRLVAAAILPSTIILLSLGSFYLGLWMAIACGVMAIYSLLGFLRLTGLKAVGYRSEAVFNDQHASITDSQSQGEFKWERLEEFRETRRDFQFWISSFATTVPKHGLSASEQNELRQLVERAQSEPAGDSPPLPLYQSRLVGDGRFPVYRYQLTTNDIAQILRTRFRPYQDGGVVQAKSSRGSTFRTVRRSFAWFAIFFMVMLGLLMNVDAGPMTWARDFAIFLLPFLLLSLYGHAKARLWFGLPIKLPPDEIEVRLCEDGVVMGGRSTTSFWHWNDVQQFFSNEHFIGMKTMNGVIRLMPKRAIGDAAAVETFLATAIDLKSVVDRADAALAPMTSVESGNPYQSPQS